jgi:hypothetical protein
MAETPVGVLLMTTGSLHDTVEADEFADDYPHESDYGTGRARPNWRLRGRRRATARL